MRLDDLEADYTCTFEGEPVKSVPIKSSTISRQDEDKRVTCGAYYKVSLDAPQNDNFAGPCVFFSASSTIYIYTFCISTVLTFDSYFQAIQYVRYVTVTPFLVVLFSVQVEVEVVLK